MTRIICCGGLVDLRLGKWEQVLADVETCDAIVADPPYSARTHEGQRTGEYDGARRRQAMGYEPMEEGGVEEFVGSWGGRARGWCVVFTSHDLASCFSAAFAGAGRYVFAPLPWVNTGGPIRLSGDGPSSWTCWVVVSRPKTREMQRWRTLPGAYIDDVKSAAGNPHIVVGAKPLGLMRAIIRDYTRPGDLVVDPFCGGGTTALACAIEGRRCITSEMDPVTFEKAKKRLERGFTPGLFQAPRVKMKQGGLL